MFLSFLLYKCRVVGETGERCEGRSRGTDVCSLHRCYFKKCKEEQQVATKWCVNHTCTNPNCLTPVTTPGKRYCSSHQCHKKQCRNPRRSGSKFCDTVHGCAIHGCPNRRVDFASYCSHHKCNVCDAEAYGPELQYCRVNQHTPHQLGFVEAAGDERQEVRGRNGMGVRGEVELRGRTTLELGVEDTGLVGRGRGLVGSQRVRRRAGREEGRYE